MMDHTRRLLAGTLVLLLLFSVNTSATLAAATTRDGHGVLQVSTQPNVPATIFVDGIARNTAQLDGLELPVGQHEVAFSGVEGFLAPAPQSVTIEQGVMTAVVGEFAPAGVLQVTTSPSDVDAVITVDGVERDRGATTLMLAAGSVEVCASDVQGYDAPGCQTATIRSDEPAIIDLAFAPTASTPVPTVPGSDRVSAGLVSFYDFAAGSGNTVEDLVGGNDLSIARTSAVSWSDAGLTFNQATLASTSTAPKNLYDRVLASQEFTVEAWITPANTTQNGPARIVTLGRDTSNTNLLVGQGEYQGSSTNIEARLHERTGNYKLATANNTLEADLTHVVMTRSSDATVRVYLDGELANQQKMATSLNGWNTSYQLGIGSELNGDRPWLGTYHLTAIYDTALTTNDITTNYQAGPGANTDIPAPAPKPTPEEPTTDIMPEAPADWKAAFDSRDINVLRSWYSANTGHEANGYRTSDLVRVGALVTTHHGQVIESVHADSIRIAHNDVTIRNSRITSSANYGIHYQDTWGQKVGGTLIEYVTFNGWKADGTGNDNHAVYLAANGSLGGATVRRVNVSGYASGVSMRANTSFEESWVHHLWRPASTVSHGTSSTIRGPRNAAVRNLLEGPGYSSALSMYADAGGALHDALVEYNVMNDAVPYYQINIPNRTYTAESENVRIRHNRFGPAARAPYVAGSSNFSHPTADIRDNSAY